LRTLNGLKNESLKVSSISNKEALSFVFPSWCCHRHCLASLLSSFHHPSALTASWLIVVRCGQQYRSAACVWVPSPEAWWKCTLQQHTFLAQGITSHWHPPWADVRARWTTMPHWRRP
jgi:hypothetical protein